MSSFNNWESRLPKNQSHRVKKVTGEGAGVQNSPYLEKEEEEVFEARRGPSESSKEKGSWRPRVNIEKARET